MTILSFPNLFSVQTYVRVLYFLLVIGNCETHQIVAFCANSIIISRPLENAGTWRGSFEPSAAAFGTERKRVCVDYAICTNSTTLKEFRKCLTFSTKERRKNNGYLFHGSVYDFYCGDG